MSPLLRSGLAISQDRICSHSPSKGALWVRRQPCTRFRLSCSRYKVWSPAVGSPTLLSSGSIPMVQSSTEKTRVLAEGRGEITGEQLTAQRKTACCNCSSWCKRTLPRSPPLETRSRRSVCGDDRLLPPACLMKNLPLSL